MGLVVILAGTAVVVLLAYRTTMTTTAGIEVITGLRQQAAVLSVLSMGVFLLLEALENGKVVVGALAAAAGKAAPTPSGLPGFGQSSMVPGMAALTRTP